MKAALQREGYSSSPMLDPRIYRKGLIAVGLAVIVAAFSLYDQQGPLGSGLAPDAFGGQNAYSTMNRLAAAYPHRRPGSVGDRRLAALIAHQLVGYGFVVHRDRFSARTVDGQRKLENVIAVRRGRSRGSIVVVAHRDALGSPAAAELSGTAVLLELARVLAGGTQHRTIVLASTTASAGGAGAAELAHSLGGPVEAVLVLGDLAGRTVRAPIVVPWSSGEVMAPAALRNTVRAAITAQTQLHPGGMSLDGQFAHLAFPISPSEGAPFGASGLPAVSLSLSGERTPQSGEGTSPGRITGLGRALLQTVSALDSGASMPRPSAYLVYDGQVVPDWSIRLFVLALMIPALIATLDGVARVCRRGHPLLLWLPWVLCGALPFAIAALLANALRVAGALPAAPSGALTAGAIPVRGSGIALLAAVGCAIVGGFLARRPMARRLERAAAARPSCARKRGRNGPWAAGAHGPTGGRDRAEDPGAAAALLMLLCVAAVAIWATNPFAALLLVPALHLWMWLVAPDLRLRRSVAAMLILGGLAPIGLLAAYYAAAIGGAPQSAWNALLMVAGGDVSLLSALEWSLFLGCLVAAIAVALRKASPSQAQDRVTITVRGPVTYAGPGSLGGTQSALRR